MTLFAESSDTHLYQDTGPKIMIYLNIKGKTVSNPNITLSPIFDVQNVLPGSCLSYIAISVLAFDHNFA